MAFWGQVERYRKPWFSLSISGKFKVEVTYEEIFILASTSSPRTEFSIEKPKSFCYGENIQ